MGLAISGNEHSLLGGLLFKPNQNQMCSDKKHGIVAVLFLRLLLNISLPVHAFIPSKTGVNIRYRGITPRALSASTLSPQGSLNWRAGLGYDIHRLVTPGNDGSPLTLGGVRLDDLGFFVVGHSDGDALLHAISDAVLGAMGLGDIGDHFPDSDPRNKGLASSVILNFALSEARKLGYTPANLDANIILQRPKLGVKLKERIRANVAEILGEGVTVNIKAKTNEGLDSIGSSKALACQAIVLMQRLA